MKTLLLLISTFALLTACAEFQSGQDTAYVGACAPSSVACVAEAPAD